MLPLPQKTTIRFCLYGVPCRHPRSCKIVISIVAEAPESNKSLVSQYLVFHCCCAVLPIYALRH